MHAELLRAALMRPLDTKARLRQTEFERHEQLVVYSLSYEFRADDRSSAPIWKADFTLTLSFMIHTDAKVTDEELDAFGAGGVVEVAHPYAREFVHHITGRMNVPAFVLDVLPPDRLD